MSPALPQTSESAPSGRIFSPSKIWTMRCATSAVLVAGFGDDGHAGEERDGRLLGEAPRREVEGVHVHGDPFARHEDVLPEEARRAAELDGVAVGEDARVAELRAEIGVGGERAGRAVDVELRVGARVAAVRERQAEELVAVRVNGARHRADDLAALGERHRAERGAPLFTRERERAREVDAARRAGGQRLLGRGVHSVARPFCSPCPAIHFPSRWL